MDKLYSKIKLLREERGMTQQELAQKVGYTSRSSITKIENGSVDIPQSKVEFFATALGTTPSKLLGISDSEWIKKELSSLDELYAKTKAQGNPHFFILAEEACEPMVCIEHFRTKPGKRNMTIEEGSPEDFYPGCIDEEDDYDIEEEYITESEFEDGCRNEIYSPDMRIDCDAETEKRMYALDSTWMAVADNNVLRLMKIKPEYMDLFMETIKGFIEESKTREIEAVWNGNDD
ncbi:MAG: helix-turn-helix transcriptional regulator [Ruthenibacterium sp.]